MCEYLARRAVDIRWLIDTSGTQRLLLHGITLPVSCCQSVYTEGERETEREARWNCARVGASLANFLLYPSRFGKEGLSPDVNFHFQSSDYDQVILTSFSLGPSDFSLRFQEWKYYRSSARFILINKSRSKFLIIHLIISPLLSFLFSMKESFQLLILKSRFLLKRSASSIF